ncbi:MAG: HDIG domain-containing protein [Ignavibacteriae bacterium]|nr:HDIG domain-containing protein [Ignavibacteria bacterium]MBI3363308.1 HDIG domain-containing protein [Ignavibacteriota bacterium]
MTTSSKNILQKLRDFLLENTRDNITLKFLIGLILIALITVMFPHPESIEYSYNVGSVWTDKDLIAQFSFPVYKDFRQYEKERQEAEKNVYPVFQRHEDVTKNQIDALGQIVQSLEEVVVARVRMMKTRASRDSLSYRESIGELPFSLTDDEWNLLHQWQATENRGGVKRFENFTQTLSSIVSDVLKTGIIDQLKMKQSRAELALRKGTEEDIIPYAKLYDDDEAINVLSARIRAAMGEGTQASLALKIVRAIVKPNILFNREESDRAIQRAADDVPRTIGFMQENERIISKHDRITDEKKLKLDSYRKARVEQGSEYIEWRHRIGIVLHVTIVIGLFTIYLFLFRKRIIHDNGKLVLISLILLLETFFAYLSLALTLTEPVQYLIFVPAASMLLTIIFDSRVAFYGTVTIALLIAGIRGNDYAFALTSLVAGALGAYTVRDIRNRTQIFRSLIFIFTGYALSIIAISLEQFESLTTITSALTYALANAVFSPVLTYGLLIFFERVFKVTTDLTLLELSDFNQPLLHQLSAKAPGTFHHSIMIGNMAEAAADAIGANSILGRVGGYYHDIGKMIKAEYFVENQVGSGNRHNRLKPRMSALIIQSHVKEGVELGREYGLPEKILDFIPQHHGTTRISYFYDKALKQAMRRPGKETINDEDFRYPGPKPQTKETGIVMLADSVEASTRVIDEITPQKLEQAIENMIKQRFIEGQLDDCDLTLRDLTKIKDAFLKILLGIHHQRIKYPEQQRSEEAAALPASKPSDTALPVVETVPTVAREPSTTAMLPETRSSPEIAPPTTEDKTPRGEREQADTLRHMTDQQS